MKLFITLLKKYLPVKKLGILKLRAKYMIKNTMLVLTILLNAKPIQ